MIKAEQELHQCVNWTRLVPSNQRQEYWPSSYQDKLLHAWELRFGQSEETKDKGREMLRGLCADKYHLRVRVRNGKNEKQVDKVESKTLKLQLKENKFDQRDWMKIGMFQKFQ